MGNNFQFSRFYDLKSVRRFSDPKPSLVKRLSFNPKLFADFECEYGFVGSKLCTAGETKPYSTRLVDLRCFDCLNLCPDSDSPKISPKISIFIVFGLTGLLLKLGRRGTPMVWLGASVYDHFWGLHKYLIRFTSKLSNTKKNHLWKSRILVSGKLYVKGIIVTPSRESPHCNLLTSGNPPS